MGDRDIAKLALRDALLRQMGHTLDLLDLLLANLRQSTLTPEQMAAVRQWERRLPDLRSRFRMLAEGKDLARESSTATTAG